MNYRNLIPVVGFAVFMTGAALPVAAQIDPHAAFVPGVKPYVYPTITGHGSPVVQGSAWVDGRYDRRILEQRPLPEQPYQPVSGWKEEDLGVPPIRPEMIAAPMTEESITVPFAADMEMASPGEFQPLEDVLRASYQDNPTLRAARAEMKATHETLPQAQSGYKPVLSGEANVTWADIDQSPAALGGADGTTSKLLGISATQPLYRGGRTQAAIEGAHAIIGAQRAILNATEQRIMRDVATAYMDVVRDQAVLELRTNNYAVIARQLEASRARFEVGELTRTDVSQAEARLARAEADRTQAVGALRSSRAVYQQLTGMAPGVLGYPQLSFAIPADLEAAIAVAAQDNPAVIASQFRHKAAQTDIDGIFGELLPYIQLFGSHSREYDPQPGLLDEVTTTAVGVSATIPFYTGGLTRSRVRQAKYVANQRLINVQEMVRQATQETVTNWEILQAAQAEITSRQAQVDAAALAREGVYREAELGSRTVLDTLDADQEYLDAQVALVAARRNEIVANFYLAATLGLLTPQILGFPEIAPDHVGHLRYTTSKILGMDVDIDEEGR